MWPASSEGPRLQNPLFREGRGCGLAFIGAEGDFSVPVNDNQIYQGRLSPGKNPRGSVSVELEHDFIARVGELK